MSDECARGLRIGAKYCEDKATEFSNMSTKARATGDTTSMYRFNTAWHACIDLRDMMLEKARDTEKSKRHEKS